jgi:uncharacterized protein
MNRDQAFGLNLDNDTAINVVALLKEPIGATRQYRLHLDAFPLDDDLLAEDVEGVVKLTRLSGELLAHVAASGRVELECVRCLNPYIQPFAVEFDAEYRPTVDVRTGGPVLPETLDDERFELNENHELDIREPLRQEIVVALPMQPVCGDNCPGPPAGEWLETERADPRFAALANLLDDER